MTNDLRCPSCGRSNDPAAEQCSQCNFPLHGTPPARASEDTERAQPVEISMRRIRPIRPRRPGGPDQALQLQLWLVLGGVSVLIVLWTAYQGFLKNNAVPALEGATAEQQRAADMARAEVERDSTNVNAQVALANVLYDTANWPEAIVHYRSALRLDPARVSSMVDLGVCYYNLSDVATAESLFTKALALDPKQPVALFNLGIVAENRGELEAALRYYHRALDAGTPASMGDALATALKRVMTKLGRKAPPLDSSAAR
ncbi:MAG TPA: tetratricopeptide repeat protein [Candidatus Acidoferrales bacterium]|nr:tetratricopeptide repeat protein [Candidatus Acidoferrales bacterium]